MAWDEPVMAAVGGRELGWRLPLQSCGCAAAGRVVPRFIVRDKIGFGIVLR